MRTTYFTMAFLFFALSLSAQVGINTPNPTATLDVNGNAKIRTAPQAATVSGYQIMAINSTNAEVSRIDPSIITTGAVNSTVYSARKTAGISLLNLNLFPTGFRAVNFLRAERTLGAETLFSDTDNTYTIPSSGVYQVGFVFRYGTGLQASILSNSPGVGILRIRNNASTLIDSRTFSGANLVALNLTISEASINSLYTFQTGDRISFGLIGASGLDAGLVGSSVSSFFIYKISN